MFHRKRGQVQFPEALNLTPFLLADLDPRRFCVIVPPAGGKCRSIDRKIFPFRSTEFVPIDNAEGCNRIVNDEQKAADLRGGQDWKMIGPPQYVIDRAQDFIDAGVDEFTFNMIPNEPEVYAELNETVLSAFD